MPASGSESLAIPIVSVTPCKYKGAVAGWYGQIYLSIGLTWISEFIHATRIYAIFSEVGLNVFIPSKIHSLVENPVCIREENRFRL